MEDGIFKTKRRGLVGGKPVDIQYLWDVEQRARVRNLAANPAPAKQVSGSKQLPLPLRAGAK